MNRFLFIIFLISVVSNAQESLTLQDSYDLVNKNYPIAKEVNLLQKKSDFDIQAINTGKLPKIEFNGQATYQNQVTQVPGQLIPPLNKDQYRISLDFNQLIYNG